MNPRKAQYPEPARPGLSTVSEMRATSSAQPFPPDKPGAIQGALEEQEKLLYQVRETMLVLQNRVACVTTPNPTGCDPDKPKEVANGNSAILDRVYMTNRSLISLNELAGIIINGLEI